MPDAAGFLKSAFAALEPDEALRQPVTSLLGVSSAAQSALEPLGIRTVFDLAASRTFATARALLAIQRDPTTAEARLNVVAADAVDAPAGVLVAELADRPIGILRGIGEAHANGVSAALDVASVRDLALWPPHTAAREVLDLAFFPEKQPGFDPDAPADLLPRSGDYPTERVFYRKLVLDAVPEPGQAAQPIENADPIDVGKALATPPGFRRLASGALLTFSQSWFAQGVTLGQLLHSMSLAPGESTRMAMIDWSRRTRAAASETISESEQLTNTMTHSRAISEVTNATAREVQSGRSRTQTEATTEQAGGGFGLDLGPLALGGSGSTSTTTTESMSVSSSFGERDLAASYAQQINDRSQQNASSVRNRRASIVREVSQEEHEQISTRVVTNYNHMHALSIQYYEVVQAFRVATQLERAEKCLFVPLQLIDLRDQAIVDRWRLVLADAALTLRARRQLTVEYGVVEVIPQTPRVTPGQLVIDIRAGAIVRRTAAAPAPGSNARPGEAGASPATPAPAAPVPSADGGTATPPDYRRAPVNTPAALLAAKGWDLEQLNAIGWATGRVLVRGGSDSVFVSDDALILGFTLRDGQAARFAARRRDGAAVTPAHSSAAAFLFQDPTPITELQSIAIQTSGDQELKTSLMLQLNILGTVFPLDVPVALRPMSALQDAVKFGGVGIQRELLDHLDANRLHYSQAIYRALDPAAIAAMLSSYTYRGLPLGQVVDPQPVAATANFLVLRLSVSATGRSEDERWSAEETAWREWLALRGLDRPAPKTEVIPLPSGGVFAEAVLGRYNSAEKIDLQRFWNWQDSPIPIAAPDIAPVQAGSRAQPEDIRPGQLSAPVVSIQTPTSLPDPTGVGAIIAAIQQGNMFRDMSGLAQTAALAQAAMQASAQGATSAAQQAGQNMKTVVDAQTERMRIAAQLAGQMMGVPATGGAAPPGKGTVTERGGELNMAEAIDAQNDAADLSDGAVEGLNGSSDGTGVGIGGADGVGVDGPVVRPERRLRRLERTFEAQQDNPQAGMAAGVVGETLNLARFDGVGAGAGTGTRVAQRGLARDLQVIARFVQNIEFRRRFGESGPSGFAAIESLAPFRGGGVRLTIYETGNPRVPSEPGKRLWNKLHSTPLRGGFAPSHLHTIDTRRMTGITGSHIFLHAEVQVGPEGLGRVLNAGKYFDMPALQLLEVRINAEVTDDGGREFEAANETEAKQLLISMVDVPGELHIVTEVERLPSGKWKGRVYYYSGDLWFVDKQGRRL